MNAEQRREAERIIEDYRIGNSFSAAADAFALLKQLLTTPPAAEVTAEEVQAAMLDGLASSEVSENPIERLADWINSRVSAAVEAAVGELQKDLDCGCGVSGCRNMQRKCRNCLAEENEGLKQQLAARPPLTPVPKESLAEYEAAMEETIPQIVEDVKRRQSLAAEARTRTMCQSDAASDARSYSLYEAWRKRVLEETEAELAKRLTPVPPEQPPENQDTPIATLLSKHPMDWDEVDTYSAAKHLSDLFKPEPELPMCPVWVLESNNGSGWKVVFCEEKPVGGSDNRNWSMICDGLSWTNACRLKTDMCSAIAAAGKAGK